jgi:sulfur carrier protein
MQITLNGKPCELPDEQVIPAILETLDVKPQQVAVAINGDVVRRIDWPHTSVRNGDIVEIVRAVGGGEFTVR